MSRATPDREAKQQRFIRALSCGMSAVAAAKAACIKQSTAYDWRQGDAGFRAAWDDAVREGIASRLATYDSELDRRAVEGVRQPIYAYGKLVGHRREYSDSLLKFGVQDLQARGAAAARLRALTPEPGRRPRVEVTIRRYDDGPPPDLDD